MRIAILGTGSVGQTLATGFAALGHKICMGTRDPAVTRGSDGFASWSSTSPSITLGSFAEAAAAGEIVVNATAGVASLEALELAGAEQLADKILIDVANPLDFSGGFPPSLATPEGDSLAEQIQRAFPRVRVVKTLNTVTAPVMVHPASLGDGVHEVFLSGNDAAAKEVVRGLLAELGWQRIGDLGGLASARGTERYLMLWVQLYGMLGTADFNIRIVR